MTIFNNGFIPLYNFPMWELKEEEQASLTEEAQLSSSSAKLENSEEEWKTLQEMVDAFVYQEKKVVSETFDQNLNQ